MIRRKFIAFIGGAALVWPFAVRARQPARGKGRRTLSLTSTQRAEIWGSLSKEATRTSVASGLNVGEVVPNAIHLLSFTDHLRKRIPAIRSYRYGLLHDQVLIVDPRTRKVAFIVGE
jgi:Protein of unknown function (DUF1236)